MKRSTAHEQSEAHSRDEKNTALSSPSSLLPELLLLLLPLRFLSLAFCTVFQCSSHSSFLYPFWVVSRFILNLAACSAMLRIAFLSFALIAERLHFLYCIGLNHALFVPRLRRC